MIDTITQVIKNTFRPRHRVSVKLLLMNEAGDRVAMTVIPAAERRLGLPGGHIDKGEDPDAALTREVYEELGLEQHEYTPAVQRGFGRNSEKILLFYSAQIKEGARMTLDPTEVAGIEWVGHTDIKEGIAGDGIYAQQIRTLLESHKKKQYS